MNSKIKDIMKSIGLLFLFLTFSSLFFMIFNINPNTLTEKKYLLYITISNFILLGIFIYIYRKTLINDLSYFKKNFFNNFFNSFKYWLFSFIIMYISNLIITKVLHQTLGGNEIAVRNNINISPILMIFNACIYSPITEELVFRKSIKDAISNKWLYIIISGLLFGFLHIISNINSPLGLIYLIPYGVFGISFAYIYNKTDNIYSTIMIHAFHNIIAIVLYLLGGTL